MKGYSISSYEFCISILWFILIGTIPDKASEGAKISFVVGVPEHIFNITGIHVAKVDFLPVYYIEQPESRQVLPG